VTILNLSDLYAISIALWVVRTTHWGEAQVGPRSPVP